MKRLKKWKMCRKKNYAVFHFLFKGKVVLPLLKFDLTGMDIRSQADLKGQLLFEIIFSTEINHLSRNSWFSCKMSKIELLGRMDILNFSPR